MSLFFVSRTEAKIADGGFLGWLGFFRAEKFPSAPNSSEGVGMVSA